MTSYVQLQDDVLGVLLNARSLARVNVVQYRKLRQESEINWSALWQTVRNGRSGAGILIEMPEIEVVNPNGPGPERRCLISVVVLEEPNLNMEPTGGTVLSAEEIADLIVEELSDIGIDGIGEFYASSKTIEPAHDFPDGIVAYRCNFIVFDVRDKKVRIPTPSIADDAGQVTLTNQAGFETAIIFYTPDGTFPGEANPGATKYDGPFDGTAMATVRWRAYPAVDDDTKLASFVGLVVQ